jgi:threonylcarbamoyladenosine tRNA methylthiotransferase MtaB
MRKFKIKTLGCKVNQAESETIGRQLEEAGWRWVGPQDPADICIVNTCTVTQRASMQSRQAVRQAIRNDPRAEVIVTGCYAQIAPDEIRAIDGVDTVVGHEQKRDIAERILGRNRKVDRAPEAADRKYQTSNVAIGHRARPFYKIQDGCNAFCTYCIVPHARGPSRSLPLETALAGIERIQSAGYSEVVLTGIHLGTYGRDLSPPTDLLQLLRRIREGRSIQRVRLSSIEPLEMTGDLIDHIAQSQSGPGRVCAHVHIPLQSGDDGILNKMRRPYSRQYFRDLITEVRRRLPEAAIGVDTLIGFPGESRQAFEDTHRLVADLPVTYLHVFPFSARRGTPAYHYSDKVGDEEIRRRCLKMRKLGKIKKSEFYNKYIDKLLEVIVETTSPTGGSFTGTSANYIPVQIESASAVPSEKALVWVRGQAVSPDLRLMGWIAAPDASIIDSGTGTN